ncbi:inverse autotransporter beta domain-containing protein [Citrobacter enshiensis]|uniref:inverse autotransporter beta domain-containing protein n=1 Tax=Citrobacter enshiensis TaxID=2971264 RepID=UPI00399D5C22
MHVVYPTWPARTRWSRHREIWGWGCVLSIWKTGCSAGNVFFDDDFTGKNRRIGIGAEAWD